MLIHLDVYVVTMVKKRGDGGLRGNEGGADDGMGRRDERKRVYDVFIFQLIFCFCFYFSVFLMFVFLKHYFFV